MTTSPFAFLPDGYVRASRLLDKAQSLGLLLMRLLVARVFWLSGLGKVDTVHVLGLRFPTPSIEQATFQLFAYEFFDGLPLWLTNIFAVTAAVGELSFSVLLALGLMARLGALGLLVMTMVIQIFVYPGEWWPVHAWWAACLVLLLTHGPGRYSVDRLLKLA